MFQSDTPHRGFKKGIVVEFVRDVRGTVNDGKVLPIKRRTRGTYEDEYHGEGKCEVSVNIDGKQVSFVNVPTNVLKKVSPPKKKKK